MLVELLKTKDYDKFFAVDEIGKLWGVVDIADFAELVDVDREPLHENDTVYYFVDKRALISIVEQESQRNGQKGR